MFTSYHRRHPLIFLFLTAAIVQGCVTTEYNVASHTQDVYVYSTEKEIAMGDNISRQVAEEFELSRNPEYLQRVDQIGRRIAAVCDRKELLYHFFVIDKDEKNAFCIPGGYIYIFTGLLNDLENDDQLAFILAHEVGHVVARHHIKKLQAVMGYNLALLASLPAEKSPGFYEGLTFAVAQMFAAYSREDEYMADELAVKYMETAGFDPRAGIDVLEKLYAYHKKEPTRPLSYFRTHPYAAQRIGNIKTAMKMPLDISDYMNE